MPARRSTRSTARRKWCRRDGIREPYDKLLIATGSRAFIPPMAGINGPDGKLQPGVFGFRTIDDCNAIVAEAKKSRRAVVIGGGLLGLEAARGPPQSRLRGPRRAPRRASHGDAARCDRRAILRSSMEAMGVNVHLKKMTTEMLGEDRVTGLAFKDGTTLECDMVVIVRRHQAECGDRPALRAHASSAPSWSTTTCARSTIRTSMWSANARSTAAASTAWWRRCGSRPRCSPTTSPATSRTPPITARSSPPSSRSWASSSPPWASPSRPRSATRSSSSPSRRRAPTRS